MIQTAINFSSEVRAVLSQYPKWLEMVIEAKDKPVLDPTFRTQTVTKGFSLSIFSV